MEEKTNGRYFYLMLKDNFYDSDDMILLESMENGYLYSNILLKLYLKSLKDKGKLMYKDRIPYSIDMLAKLTRHNVDIVRQAIKVFEDMGIIDVLDNGAIFMLDIENYIGKSSTEADRRRKYDRRIAEEKRKTIGMVKSPQNSLVKSHAYLDLDLDLDLDQDQERYNCSAKAEQSPLCKQIIDYLNAKLGTHYKSTTPKTRTLIKARLNEGFTLEDFKQVIDKKYIEWHKDKNMCKYLRPETLFGNKFEGYLNQEAKRLTTRDIQDKIDFTDF